jgi:homocitrate synthase
MDVAHTDSIAEAGIHAKAILNNPSTYEIINPQDFGMSRYVHFASR